MKRILLAATLTSVLAMSAAASQIPGKDVMRGATDYVLDRGRVIQISDEAHVGTFPAGSEADEFVWQRIWPGVGEQATGAEEDAE